MFKLLSVLALSLALLIGLDSLADAKGGGRGGNGGRGNAGFGRGNTRGGIGGGGFGVGVGVAFDPFLAQRRVIIGGFGIQASPSTTIVDQCGNTVGFVGGQQFSANFSQANAFATGAIGGNSIAIGGGRGGFGSRGGAVASAGGGGGQALVNEQFGIFGGLRERQTIAQGGFGGNTAISGGRGRR
jgi:hypothetical protein